MRFIHTVPVSASTTRSSDDWIDTVSNPGTTLQHPPSCGFISTLSPSLRSGLRRFAEEPAASDLLPVFAASVRHAQSLTLHLAHADGVIRLSVFPRDQLFHCFTDICALFARGMSHLHFVCVEPEISVNPTDDTAQQDRGLTAMAAANTP